MGAIWQPSISQQIAELKRERQMRAQVYPKLIASGKLRRQNAEFQSACLDAAIATLERLATQEPT